MIARRRWLAASVGMPALAWAGALRAQANAPVVIGWLSPNRRDASRASFIEGMSVLGWKLGAQYVLEERWAQARAERLAALAQEIVAKKPPVIVAITSSAARAAAATAPTTPIVLANGDPMSTGLVQSLAQPGGMITKLSGVAADAGLKVIELLVQAMPKLRRMGVLADSAALGFAATARNARRAAERLRVEAVIVGIAKPDDVEPARWHDWQNKRYKPWCS